MGSVNVCSGSGSLEELGRVVWQEISALPVALEYRRHLGDPSGLRAATDSHVPLEAGDLRRVGKV